MVSNHIHNNGIFDAFTDTIESAKILKCDHFKISSFTMADLNGAIDSGMWLNMVNVKPPYLFDLEVESTEKFHFGV